MQISTLNASNEFEDLKSSDIELEIASSDAIISQESNKQIKITLDQELQEQFTKYESNKDLYKQVRDKYNN